MPQASDEDREKMVRYFGGPGGDDTPVLKWLSEVGWTFPKGICTRPSPNHIPTPQELECVYFLCDEWDYGYKGSTITK